MYVVSVLDIFFLFEIGEKQKLRVYNFLNLDQKILNLFLRNFGFFYKIKGWVWVC